MSKALFEKIANAQTFENGVWLNPGSYMLEVQKILAEKKRKGNMFIVEFNVLEAVQTDPQVKPNPVGTRASLVINLDKDSGPGNAKEFAASLADEPGWTKKYENPADAQAANASAFEGLATMCSDAQPFKFFRIRDEANNKPTRAGGVFTAHHWQHVPPSDEEIAKIKARQASAK